MRKWVAAAALVLCACTSDDETGGVEPPGDSATTAETSTPIDSSMPADSETPDTSMIDSTTELDSTSIDSKPSDSTAADSVSADSITADSTSVDSVSADTFVADTFVADTAMTDAAAVTCTADPGGGKCNSLVMPSGIALVTSEITTLPTVSGGGAFPDGMYKLTREILLPGKTAKTSRHIFIKAGGGTCYQNLVQDSAGTDTTRATGNIALAGDTTSNSITCPIVFGPISGTYKSETLSGGKIKITTLSADTYREWEQL
jgi:hypothetical protein